MGQYAEQMVEGIEGKEVPAQIVTNCICGKGKHTHCALASSTPRFGRLLLGVNKLRMETTLCRACTAELDAVSSVLHVEQNSAEQSPAARMVSMVRSSAAASRGQGGGRGSAGCLCKRAARSLSLM